MADGIGTFSPLNYGSSTGGSAGQGETTNTLGVDHKDATTTPDVYHISNTQISQIKNLLLLETADNKGGTRLFTRTQSANPFGANEQGLWIDTSGNLWFSFGGVTTQLVIGVGQRGWSAITTGTGNGHEYLDVTLGSSFAAATGASGYNIDVQISLTTNTDPMIVWDIVNKTSSGFRIRFSGDFNGEVRWRAF